MVRWLDTILSDLVLHPLLNKAIIIINNNNNVSYTLWLTKNLINKIIINIYT